MISDSESVSVRVQQQVQEAAGSEQLQCSASATRRSELFQRPQSLLTVAAAEIP